ncbi:MAG: hypothetical protein ACT443_03350 [Gemmatimonadota bacterium]
MIRRAYVAAALAAALLLAGRTTPAHAQLGWTFVGVGEFDTDDVILVLGGVSVSPQRRGWSPVGGVSAFYLQFPIGPQNGDDTRNITAVVPSVGIKNNFGSGAFQLRVGYSFRSSDRDDDTDTIPAFAAEVGEDGVVNTAQVDYWGSGAWNAQAIATYNYGSEAFWGRGRLARRLFGFGDDGAVSLGAEAAYLDSDNYAATKLGGLVMFNPGRGTLLNAAVGRKLGRDDFSDATYFTFELVLYGR